MTRAGALLYLVTLPALADTFSYAPRGCSELTLRRQDERIVLIDDRSHTIVASAPAASTNRVVINGADGAHDDSLTIDLTQPLALAGGIDYDGGDGGWDVLTLTGGRAEQQRITQLSPHDGVIDIDGLVIRYRNLEPITDTAPAASLTIDGTAGEDTVTISDGPGGTTTVSSPTFESVTFANKTNVVFDGMGGGDRVDFSNPTPATGLQSFIVRNVGLVVQTQPVRYPSLGVSSTGFVFLGHESNDVDRIEITSLSGVILVDADDFIVGGVSPDLAGIREGGGGGLNVRSGGSITLADMDGAEIMTAGTTAGDISIIAAGDLTATVDRPAIVSPGGGVRVQANSIRLGTAGANFANDVRAHTAIVLFAWNELTIAGLTTVRSGGGPLGGPWPVAIRANGVKFVYQRDGAQFIAGGTIGGDVEIVSEDVSFLGTVPAATSESGDVLMWALDLVIAPTSGLTAPLGRVSIAGGEIHLGTIVDVPNGTFSNSPLRTGPQELSDAELDRAIAPTVEVISTYEPMLVTAPITFTGGTELVVQGSTALMAEGTGSLTAPILTFRVNSKSPNNWVLTPTAVQIGAGTPVPYSGATTLNARDGATWPFAPTLADANTISVTPSAATVMNIAGSRPQPPASPGDTLDFDLTSVMNPVLTATLTATGYQGSLTSSNRQPVNFVEIETLIDAPVDLAITKTDGAATAVPGNPVAYTIVVTNPAPIPVAGAPVSDAFPSALTGVEWTCSASAGSTCTSAGTGNLNDAVTLAATGGTVTYTVTATIDPSATGTLTNTATVTTPAGYVETDASNNTAMDTTTLAPAADLVLVKSTSTPGAVPRREIAYTITLRNAGPSSAQDVVLTDVLPAGTSFVSLSAPPGYTCTTGSTVTCTRAVLPPSATPDTFTLIVRVETAAEITNTATVSSTTFDPVSGNSVGTVAVAHEPAIPALSGAMLLLLAALLAVIALRVTS